MLDVVALSFIIGYIRGGRIREIPKFYKLWLLAIGFLLQYMGSLFFVQWAGIIVSISYIFMIMFFFNNREHEDIRIFMLGWFLNALVIWANSGKMPVDLEQAKRIGEAVEPLINGTSFKHIALTAETKLPFLADFIYKPIIVTRVISIGDIFVMLGTFLLVQRIMNKPISLIRLREGNSYAAKQ